VAAPPFDVKPRIAMSRRIAEELRQLAVKCTKLADESKDRDTANELEGVSAELAEKARELDRLFSNSDEAS
jgi:hypothetical protein